MYTQTLARIRIYIYIYPHTICILYNMLYIINIYTCVYVYTYFHNSLYMINTILHFKFKYYSRLCRITRNPLEYKLFELYIRQLRHKNIFSRCRLIVYIYLYNIRVCICVLYTEYDIFIHTHFIPSICIVRI